MPTVHSLYLRRRARAALPVAILAGALAGVTLVSRAFVPEPLAAVPVAGHQLPTASLRLAGTARQDQPERDVLAPAGAPAPDSPRAPMADPVQAF